HNDSGKVQDAQKMVHVAAQVLEKHKGFDDPQTLSYAINDAQMLLTLDRIDEGEALTRKVYEARLRVSGADNDQTITALEALGGAIYQRGDVAKAADVMKQV